MPAAGENPAACRVPQVAAWVQARLSLHAGRRPRSLRTFVGRAVSRNLGCLAIEGCLESSPSFPAFDCFHFTLGSTEPRLKLHSSGLQVASVSLFTRSLTSGSSYTTFPKLRLLICGKINPPPHGLVVKVKSCCACHSGVVYGSAVLVLPANFRDAESQASPLIY